MTTTRHLTETAFTFVIWFLVAMFCIQKLIEGGIRVMQFWALIKAERRKTHHERNVP